MTDDRTGYARPTSAANTSVTLLVVWSWFVWGGRIRNLSGQPPQGWERLPVAAVGSFVVLAACGAGDVGAPLAPTAMRARP
jgi:hypothetical protein